MMLCHDMRASQAPSSPALTARSLHHELLGVGRRPTSSLPRRAGHNDLWGVHNRAYTTAWLMRSPTSEPSVPSPSTCGKTVQDVSAEPATRFLVVEDEAITAMELRLTLTDIGFDVCGVTASGEDAVRKAVEMQPDVVLMDIRLKGQIDGIEAARQIREQGHSQIIFLTAHADDETKRRATTIGPAEYLLKPYTDCDLRACIQAALSKRQPG